MKNSGTSPQTHPELPREQGYVAWAIECLHKMIERTRSLPDSAADRMSQLALERTMHSRVNQLLGSETEILFGRLDMNSDETFYVGKSHVDGESLSDTPAVVDWRTDLGECFYQATRSNPAGVGRRRTITVKRTTVLGLSDEMLTAGFEPPALPLEIPDPPVPPQVETPPRAGLAPAAAPAVPTPTEAEPAAAPSERAPSVAEEPAASPPQAPLAAALRAVPGDDQEAGPPAAANPFEDLADEAAALSQLEPESLNDIVAAEYELRASDLLLDELERERSGSMGEIVATIQADQDRLIRADPETPLAIQGGPGTGKTVVALHRAAWVLYQQRDRMMEPSVLIVGPNPNFLEYTRGVLPALGELATVQATVDELAVQGLTSADRLRVRPRREESPQAERLKGDPRLCEVIALAVWSHVAPEPIEVGFGRFSLRLSLEEVQDIIESCWFGRVPYGEARREVAQRISGALGQELTRRGGAAATTADTLSQLEIQVRRSLADGGVMSRMFPPVAPRTVVRQLYVDEGFRDRVADELDASERAVLASGVAVSKKGKVRYEWSAADLPLLDEAAVVIAGPPQRFAHVVIDEAQDLSPMQWRVIRRRSVGKSATIAGDLAQATTAWSPTSWDDVASWGGYGDSIDVSHLRLGYRVPQPIMAYAGRLLSRAAPGLDQTQSFRPGSDPVVVATDRRELLDTVMREVRKNRRLAGSLAVICDPDTERRLRAKLEAAADGVADVSLVVDVQSKGLEYDRIIVVEPARIARGGDSGLRRLYVCLTRATKQLTVVHAAPLPAELGPPPDWRQRDSTARLRHQVRDSRLKGATGTKEWRSHVAEEYPQAYRRWSAEEDAQLTREVADGRTVAEIAEIHQRRTGGISSRIRKLGLNPPPQ